MKVNLNQKVSFKLTPYGAKILDKHKEKLFEDLYREAQLWDVMRIFGDKMFIGDDTPFVDNIIEVKK